MISIYQVDAFTQVPFRGNPAAVCILNAAAEDRWMQEVAREMNLSETAFLVPEKDQEERGFRLRWFTPTTEVRLCGHATLASAHSLWESGVLSPHETAVFYTLSGRLTATRTLVNSTQGKDWIELDFPESRVSSVQAPEGLIESLNRHSEPLFIGKNPLDFYLVELETEEEVRGLSPNFARLKSLNAEVIVTSRASQDSPYDFVSRFFAPGIGIDEDPVTGAAHCSLGPYWREKLEKESLFAYQASLRGGEVRIRFKEGRVLLAGQAVTVLEGKLKSF